MVNDSPGTHRSLEERYRDYHGIPVRIQTKEDVSKYFKWHLDSLWKGAQAVQMELTRIGAPGKKEEMGRALLAYWQGEESHFESLVAQETLRSDLELIDTKDYRAVKSEILKRIKLCSGPNPRLGFLTPRKTKTEHILIWGYSRIDAAFKPGSPLQKIWDSSGGGRRALELPCDEIQPIVERFRKENGWRSPRDASEMLDMYQNEKAWK